MLDGIFAVFSDRNTESLTGTTEAFDRKHRTNDRKHRKVQTGNTDSAVASSTRNTETFDRKHRRWNLQIDRKHRWQTRNIDRKHRRAKFNVLAHFNPVLTRNTERPLTRNTEVEIMRPRGRLRCCQNLSGKAENIVLHRIEIRLTRNTERRGGFEHGDQRGLAPGMPAFSRPVLTRNTDSDSSVVLLRTEGTVRSVERRSPPLAGRYIGRWRSGPKRPRPRPGLSAWRPRWPATERRRDEG